jgi:drug/metabolite transporter (DMT)-like permease
MKIAAPPAAIDNPRAIALLAFSAATISTMHVMARWLSAEVHPFEIAFFRNLVVFAVTLPLVWRLGPGAFRTTRPGLHLIRGGLGIAAMLTWFYALSITPVAEATAISFTQVLFTTAGAALLLGDRLGWRRGSAMAVGFAGVLIMLRPGAEAFSVGGAVVLVSAAFWAASLLCTKVLTRTDPPQVCVFLATCVFLPISLLAALPFWRWPDGAALLMMLGIGLLSAVAHLAIAEALRVGEATAVMPIDFSRLLFAGAIGWAWLGEAPDAATWIGAPVVAGAALYIHWRESRDKARALAIPPARTGDQGS